MSAIMRDFTKWVQKNQTLIAGFSGTAMLIANEWHGRRDVKDDMKESMKTEADKIKRHVDGLVEAETDKIMKHVDGHIRKNKILPLWAI